MDIKRYVVKLLSILHRSSLAKHIATACNHIPTAGTRDAQAYAQKMILIFFRNVALGKLPTEACLIDIRACCIDAPRRAFVNACFDASFLWRDHESMTLRISGRQHLCETVCMSLGALFIVKSFSKIIGVSLYLNSR